MISSTMSAAFFLLLLVLPSQAASYSDRNRNAYLIDDRQLPSDTVLCESSDDCSYDGLQQQQQQQQQHPLRTRDRPNQRCKDDDDCLLQGRSVNLADTDINDEMVPRRPFAADPQFMKKTNSILPTTVDDDDVPSPQALKHGDAAVDYCHFVCYVMAKAKHEVRLMNECITQYCASSSSSSSSSKGGMDIRLPSLEKRWGNRVGRWSKRWGNRVCLEAHCRPFENNVRAFLACGQSQCHG